MASRPKIGLALGSGGFRGFAHIGVIQVLQENNIPIDCIAGASIGALVGAYFSLHSNFDLLEKAISMSNREKLPSLLGLGFRGGIVSGRKFEIFLEKVLGRKNFSDCQFPFKIVATDLISGQAQILDQGRLAKAVRASASVPLLFEPVKYQGHLLVDGALSNPVPVDLLTAMGADKVIAVNLYHAHEFKDRRFNMPGVAMRATRIAIHNLAKQSTQEADIIMNPDTSDFISAHRYKRYFNPVLAQALIDIGRREAKKFLPDILKMIK